MELDLVHSGHRFVVEIDGKRMAAFTECTLPTLEIEVEEHKEGGLNDYVHVLPIRRKSGRVTLKRGLTNSTELLKWYQEILAGQVKSATRSLSVIMLDTKGTEMARWDFLEAIPVKWTGPQLKSDQGAVAIETLELIVHDYMA